MKLDYSIGDGAMMLFPTPIFRHVFPNTEALNGRLREIVLEVERRDGGVTRSNVGAWHSREDLLCWPHPEIAELTQMIKVGTQRLTELVAGEEAKGMHVDMDGGAWANVTRDRGFNKLHNHPGCTWSGVYYVTLGDGVADAEPGMGAIEFLDPRMGVDTGDMPGEPFGGKYRVVPEPGLLLMFPSWLYHFVNPFHGSGERISIAFNIKLRLRPAVPGGNPPG
jgi:uncharacterized protein (TIGR02466 family)